MLSWLQKLSPFICCICYYYYSVSLSLTLGFLQRNLQRRATELKETAYKTLGRPILEYACSVWDPYAKKNIDKLENVQHRAARFVPHNYHKLWYCNTSSIIAMLDCLGWPFLQHRWKLI